MSRVRVLPVTDFSGGLNLRDDAFQLRKNESWALENVDLLPQGGVARRHCRVAFNTLPLSLSPTLSPDAIMEYASDSYAHVVVQVGGNLAFASNSGVFTAITLSGSPSTMRMALASSLADTSPSGPIAAETCGYIVRGTGMDALRYEAHSSSSPTISSLVDASTSWNDNISVPVGGRFPRAACVLEHRGLMWVANTVEGGTAYPTRVRFSHPGQPEDWRTNDYFDIGPGEDGDEIVGLAAFGQELLVFKRRSIWTINGPNPDSFRVAPLSQEVGTVSCDSVRSGEGGVAWFDPQRGVFLYNREGIQWLWPKLHERLTDGTITAGSLDKVRVGWLNHRLFVSVPWETTYNARTFVYDPQVGGWTVYTYGCAGILDFKPALTEPKRLVLSATTPYVWDVEGDTGSGDQLTEAVTRTGFSSFFTTGWFDAGLPAARKRWRRPQFVFDADVDTTFQIESRKDYDLLGPVRAFQVSASGNLASAEFTSGAELYDDADLYDSAELYEGGASVASPTAYLVWGSGRWGESLWGSAETGSEALVRSVRGPGVAEAISLKVFGPTDRAWNMNAIHLKYIPMKVRG